MEIDHDAFTGMSWNKCLCPAGYYWKFPEPVESSPVANVTRLLRSSDSAYG